MPNDILLNQEDILRLFWVRQDMTFYCLAGVTIFALENTSLAQFYSLMWKQRILDGSYPIFWLWGRPANISFSSVRFGFRGSETTININE